MTIKVILTVPERVNFPSIMPLQGSLAEVDMINTLNERVKITEQEAEEYRYTTLLDGRFAYDATKARPREFTFESYEILLIQQGISSHDERKTLRPWNAELAKKIKAIQVKSKNTKP